MQKLENLLRLGGVKYPEYKKVFAESLDIFREMSSDKIKLAELEFIINEVLFELIRENQENGKLKILDKDLNPKSDMRFFDSRYISFIIQSYNYLISPEIAKALDSDHYKLICMVETYLRNFAKNPTIEPLQVSEEALENFSPSQNLNPATRKWIQQNLGFLTFKNKINSKI